MYRKLSFALAVILLCAFQLYAQLPPSIHRISPFDTEIDGPYSPDVIRTFFVPSFNAEFGTAWNADGKSLILKTGGELTTRPITILFRAKLDDTDKDSILIANESRDSEQHWELLSTSNEGKLKFAIYPTEYSIESDCKVVDGQWHYFGLVLTENSVKAYQDGKQIFEGTFSAFPLETDKGLLGIGCTTENRVGTEGQLDELLIREGLPEGEYDPTVIPAKPFTADEKTILLAHFEGPTDLGDQEIHDLFDSWIASRKGLADQTDPVTYEELLKQLPSKSTPIEGKMAAVNQGQADISLGSDLMSQLFPGGGREIYVAPGSKPEKGIEIKKCDASAFDAECARIGITDLSADEFRPGVFSFWGEQFVELSRQISGEIPLPRGAADQVFDQETLVADGENYPVQIVLRRAADILENLDGSIPDETWNALSSDLDKVSKAAEAELSSETPDEDRLAVDFFIAAALRRKLMISDPALDDLTKILFLARGCYAGCRLTNEFNTDQIGGHFATQVYGFNSIHGGGIFVLTDWRKKDPTVTDLLKGKKVTATPVCSRLAGQELNTGSFYKPEVSYDGKTVYFSHTGAMEHRWIWTPDTTWNIFRLDLGDGEKPDRLTQLTDSAYNDFDVCELPSGRLVFASERRGGFIRCFTEGAMLRVTTSVLHSMKADGTDIYPISFFETGEWRPSVDRNGMLAYTRWDYTDRENCLGSTYWSCFPDGRNPRSPQGNYPQPWFTFDDNTHGDHRWGRCEDAPSALPMTELQFRAIPDSHRMIFTAAPHHGETFGSLCMLDLRVPDDNHMARVRRLTPYFPFPEAEIPARSQYCYGSPWPISEDLYMCNRWEDLILLDRYGNEELLCEREILPIGYDPRLRLSEPIPLAARPKPPVIPNQTTQGEDYAGQSQKSTIGVINVNIADLPLPEDRKPKRLRVIQVIPKPNPWMDQPWIGYATENTPRIPLGTAPIEEDGSVYFEAPSGKQLLFQLLDENDMAIQTMRAVTYLHPGENLLCIGCHEPQDISLENETQKVTPIAFSRAASKLEPECGPVEPLSFYRLVKPVIEKSCLPCHREKNIEPTSMDHEDLRPYVFYYSGGMSGTTTQHGPSGGSRSRPGHVGASESKLGKILFDEAHINAVSQEDRHKLILWMDSNAPRLSAFQDEEAQKRGELVWPILDTEPCELYSPCEQKEKE